MRTLKGILQYKITINNLYLILLYVCICVSFCLSVRLELHSKQKPAAVFVELMQGLSSLEEINYFYMS